MCKILIFVLLIFQTCLAHVYAHSVIYTITRNESITLKAGFGENDPMSYAIVRIFSPDNKDVEYQNGRTDKNGCFSFIPDRPGQWTITVIDGTGHGLKEVITVNKGMELAETKSHGLTLIQKLFISLCIVWGLMGTFLFFRKK